MTIPLVGFIFQGEKTMIPYKEFDFLFNGITIPDLEFHFPTPWDTNLEKFRHFFTLKVQFWKFPATSPCLEYQFQKIPAVYFSCWV